MRTFGSLLALSLIASVAACTTGQDDDAASDESAVTTGWVTSEVQQRLRVSNPRDEGTLWAVSTGNLLTPDSILQVPKVDFWGQSSVPANHSQYILDEIYGVMTRAQDSLDITSLWVPTGRFMDTMRKALADLDKKNSKVYVRFLFGGCPNHEPDL